MCLVCSLADIAKRTHCRVCLDRVPAWLENASGLENLTSRCAVHNFARLYKAHTVAEVGVALIAMS